MHGLFVGKHYKSSTVLPPTCEKFLARRITYQFQSLPIEINNYETTIFRDVFNKTIINEKFVTLNVDQKVMAVSEDGLIS